MVFSCSLATDARRKWKKTKEWHQIIIVTIAEVQPIAHGEIFFWLFLMFGNHNKTNVKIMKLFQHAPKVISKLIFESITAGRYRMKTRYNWECKELTYWSEQTSCIDSSHISLLYCALLALHAITYIFNPMRTFASKSPEQQLMGLKIHERDDAF